MTEQCRHCHVRPVDDDEPDASAHLCAECMDLAVWGAACPACGRVPSGRRTDHCED